MFWFIAAVFVVWRFGLFIIAWLGSRFVPFSPRFPYADVYLIPSGLPDWLWSFANFDGVHYLTISRYGYAAQFTQVLFPLQPVLLGFIHRFVPFFSDVLLGILFSSSCFMLALLALWKLLRLDYKNETIRWAIVFLLTFPTSFYFGSLYTESLFLLFTLLAFYSARTKRWIWAGVFGGLAAATRLIGIFLLPALLWEEWEQRKFKIQNSKIKSTNKNSKLAKNFTTILHFTFYILHSPLVYLIPLGLLAYMLYLQIVFSDWLYFWHAQPVFGAERSGGSIVLLPQVIWRYGKMLTTLSWQAEAFWIAARELISIIVCFGLLYWAFLINVRKSYPIFSVLAVMLPTFTGTLSSMPRYILVALPMYIALGIMPSRWGKIAALFFSCILLMILTVLFTRGHWVA